MVQPWKTLNLSCLGQTHQNWNSVWQVSLVLWKVLVTISYSFLFDCTYPIHPLYPFWYTMSTSSKWSVREIMSSLLEMLISHSAYFKYFSLVDLAYETLAVTEKKCPSTVHGATSFWIQTNIYLVLFFFTLPFILQPLSSDIPALFLSSFCSY